MSLPDPPELLLRVGEQPHETWDDGLRGRLSFTTLFSRDRTPTAGLTSGVAALPEGGWLGLHRHAAVETYFVLAGSGLLTLAGCDLEIGAGTAVQIPGDTEHGVRNTGATELRVHYVFAADSLSDIIYRFSADSGN